MSCNGQPNIYNLELNHRIHWQKYLSLCCHLDWTYRKIEILGGLIQDVLKDWKVVSNWENTKDNKDLLSLQFVAYNKNNRIRYLNFRDIISFARFNTYVHGYIRKAGYKVFHEKNKGKYVDLFKLTLPVFYSYHYFPKNFLESCN